MADALAVLDAFELEQGVGDRPLVGRPPRAPPRGRPPGAASTAIVCIDTLGASRDVLPEFEDGADRRSPPDEQLARVEEIERARGGRRGDRGGARRARSASSGRTTSSTPRRPRRRRSSTAASSARRRRSRSIMEHFEAGDARDGLREGRGCRRSSSTASRTRCRSAASLDTAKLIRGARVAPDPALRPLPVARAARVPEPDARAA